MTAVFELIAYFLSISRQRKRQENNRAHLRKRQVLSYLGDKIGVLTGKADKARRQGK